MPRKVQLPSLTSRDLQPDVRAYLSRVREIFETMDFLTRADLEELLASRSGSTTGGGTTGGGTDGGGGGFTPGPRCGATQYPTAPTGLAVTGAFTNIILTWDAAPYCGHAYTEVWAAAEDDIGIIELVGQTAARVYAHPVAEGTSLYYWVRHVNVDGVLGPYNGISGTLGETERSPEYLLELLTGAITESQLYEDLASDVGAIDGLSAQYTVKIDANGYVSGFGLASEPPVEEGGTPVSSFGIRADRFWVASPTGPGIEPMIPFVVTTTPVIINGEPIDPGVYIDAAKIINGSITNAKIANATIDDAKIANLTANKLLSSEVEVGVEIRSTSYNSGNYGWMIDGNGNAYFENATVRGTVWATNGQFYGTLLGGQATSYSLGTGLYSGGNAANTYRWRVGAPSGARVQWNGSEIQIYNGSNQLTMTSGGLPWDYVLSKPAFKNFAFIDQLTSANVSTYIETAAISQAFIADAAVGTLKIANNAVTVPMFANGGFWSAPLRFGDQILALTLRPFYSVGPTGVLILIQVKAAATTESATNVVVEVYRNGLLVGGQITSTPEGFGTSHAFSFYDAYPGSGTLTYQLYLRNDWPTGGWYPEYFSMALFGAMR